MENKNKIILEKIKKKASRSALITLIAVVGAGLAGAWTVNLLIRRIIHDRSEVVVPEIEGKPLEDALEILSGRNLSLYLVARKYDPDIPSGSVISQTPPPGLMVREGGVVETVISSGGQVVFVPDVREKPLREAEMLIRQAGLQMGEQTRTYSRTVEEGYVVSQSPPPDEVIQSDAYVDIVVSLGSAEYEEIVEMPDLKGMRIRDAERVLNRMGLRIAAVKAEIHGDLVEGTVVEQQPEYGEEVEPGESVNLIISRKEHESLQVREEVVSYMPSEDDEGREVVILLSDDIRDEYRLYRGIAVEGEEVKIPVRVLGRAEAKVLVDGDLVLEKIYKEEDPEEEEPVLLEIEEEFFFDDSMPEVPGEEEPVRPEIEEELFHEDPLPEEPGEYFFFD